MNRRLGLFILLIMLAAVFGRMGRASAQAGPTPTPRSVIAPIVTATPRADGSLVHVVGFGQTLPEVAKAYGVTVGEIQRLNGLPPDSSTLYSGQKLLIIPLVGSEPLMAAATPTIAPTAVQTNTPTVEPPAPTQVAPASSSTGNEMVLPLAGGLILLGGFLLLAAALVIQRRK